MSDVPRLMVVTAHPDDETLGFGGVLARYASEGVETMLVTATRGERGRYFGHAAGSPEHPGRAALAELRARELRAAASMLGIKQTSLLRYEDGGLDGVDAADVICRIAWRIRRARPHVVLTFAPDGAYGHPDHIAISQLTTAAIVAAADSAYGCDRLKKLDPPHTVSKLYFLAWNETAWATYQRTFKKLVANVDGVERQASPWPDWALTTVIDTRAFVSTVSSAVSCHESQVGAYAALKTLTPAERDELWGSYSLYRAFSLVNGGRARESDLFAGIARPALVHA